MQNNARILGAEAFGTAVLVMGGAGTAILMPPGATNVLAAAFTTGASAGWMAASSGSVTGDCPWA